LNSKHQGIVCPGPDCAGTVNNKIITSLKMKNPAVGLRPGFYACCNIRTMCRHKRVVVMCDHYFDKNI
jgi:hypothetical protein